MRKFQYVHILLKIIGEQLVKIRINIRFLYGQTNLISVRNNLHNQF